MIYLDASAIVKLARVEPETAALRAWVAPGRPLATSAVSEVEVPRAVRRVEPAALEAARAVAAGIEVVELAAEVRQLAAALQPAGLRSLDAIHLASAISLTAPGGAVRVDAFVTYDRRLAAAARAEGLAVVAPGAVPPV